MTGYEIFKVLCCLYLVTLFTYFILRCFKDLNKNSMIGKNNPFNIRFSIQFWKGQTGSTKGFCNFSERKYGIRAAIYLVMRSYRKKGFDTIERIVSRFAPPQENKTSAYIDYVTSISRIPRDYPLITKEQYFLVLHAMSRFEGNSVGIDELVLYYFEFKKDFRYEKD